MLKRILEGITGKKFDAEMIEVIEYHIKRDRLPMKQRTNLEEFIKIGVMVDMLFEGIKQKVYSQTG